MGEPSLCGVVVPSRSCNSASVTAVLEDARQSAREYGWNVGLAYCGDASKPGTWSGTPASLGDGMRDHGARVVPLGAQASALVETITAHALTLLRLPRVPGASLMERARLSRTISLYTGSGMSVLRSRGLRADIRRAGTLDAIVQIQTNYAVPPGVPVATFEDMTVAQAVELPYPDWQALSRPEQAAAMDRQRRAYERASACCFTTQWAANSAISDYGIEPEKTHVVGVGRNHVTRPVDRDWSTPRYLFVGSNWRMKNGDAVLEAFARVREQIPLARLDLVGAHPDVDAPGVHGHGWLSLADDVQRRRLDELFESATCFVLPSLCDASAISYVEAGAAGVPSIGSAVGGSSELIGDGGCVLDPHDHEALLTTMLHFADGDTARAAGERARVSAERFTWPQVAQRLLSALEPHVARTRPS